MECIIILDDAHKEALDKIRAVNHGGYTISEVLMEFIDDYLLREHGRLGKVIDGEYS